MASQGDDCYFYYYSSCAKGALCPFRHCEAALGNETVCSLWREGRCYRQVCQFRHMESNKNRNIIACFWETQPTGCLKPHCPFKHEKPRNIDGQMPPLPPAVGKPGLPESADKPLPSVSLTTSSATSSFTQFTGAGDASSVLQGHGSEVMTPSPPIIAPTIAPVIVKPEDSEDDNEESSHDGSPVRRRLGSPLKPVRIIPTRKETSASSVQAPSLGIKTLAEIRQQKASSQSAVSSSSDNNIISMPRPVTSSILSRRFAKITGDVEPGPAVIPATTSDSSIISMPRPATSILSRRFAQLADDDREPGPAVIPATTSDSNIISMPRPATSILSRRFAQLADDDREPVPAVVPTTSRRIIATVQKDDSLQEEMPSAEKIHSLADVHRAKVLQRLGKPGTQRAQLPPRRRQLTAGGDNQGEAEETSSLEGIQVKSLADIRREKLMQRVGRTLSPSPDEARSEEEEESEALENVRVKTLADIRREKLMQRLGRPHSPATDEAVSEERMEDESGNLENFQVKSLADIKREKLMQRLGRPHSPATDEAVSEERMEDESGNLENVQIKSLADIKQEKLMQRLGNRPLKRKTESDSPTQGVRSLQEIKRGKLMRRLGNRTEEKEKEDDGDFDPDGIQVKSLRRETRREKLMQRLGKPSEATAEDTTVLRQGAELFKKFVGLTAQHQRGTRIQVKSLAQIRADKEASSDDDDEEEEEEEEESPKSSVPEGVAKVAVKSLADIRAESESRIKSLAEIRAEKAGKQGPGSIAVKSLAEIRAERAAAKRGEEDEAKQEFKSRGLPSSRLGRKRQERALYRPPSSSNQGIKSDVRARLGGRMERQPSLDDEDSSEKDAGSPRKESLASRLQRKTISFLPKPQEPSGDKIAVKSLLEIRREKRLRHKPEEKPDSPGGIVVKSLADIRREKRLQGDDGDKCEDDDDRTFDPSKIEVKTLVDIRREKRLHQEDEKSTDNDGTSESGGVGAKSEADLRREKRLRLEDSKNTDANRTSNPSGILVKSLADIKREKRLRQGDAEKLQEVERGSSDKVKIKRLAEIQQAKSGTVQATVTAVKKSGAGQQAKKLTDAERRERRAKIWKQELQPENPSPISSVRTLDRESGGAIVAVKRTVDSSLSGLKVKSLDDIKREKQKVSVGRGEDNVARKGERQEESRIEETVSPAKLTRTTPSSPSSLQGLPLRRKLKVPSNREQQPTAARGKSVSISSSSTTTNTSIEPDSSTSQPAVTTHSRVETSATAAKVGSPPSQTSTDLTSTAKVPAGGAAVTAAGAAVVAAATTTAATAAAAAPVVTSSIDLQSRETPAQESFPEQQDVIAPSPEAVMKHTSVPDVNPHQQPAVSKSLSEGSSAKRPHTERLTSITDDLDNLLEDLGDSKQIDVNEDLEDDDILLELDELINS